MTREKSVHAQYRATIRSLTIIRNKVAFKNNIFGLRSVDRKGQLASCTVWERDQFPSQKPLTFPFLLMLVPTSLTSKGLFPPPQGTRLYSAGTPPSTLGLALNLGPRMYLLGGWVLSAQLWSGLTRV